MCDLTDNIHRKKYQVVCILDGIPIKSPYRRVRRYAGSKLPVYDSYFHRETYFSVPSHKSVDHSISSSGH